jgi:hypothetical protein
VPGEHSSAVCVDFAEACCLESGPFEAEAEAADPGEEVKHAKHLASPCDFVVCVSCITVPFQNNGGVNMGAGP